MGTGGMGTGCMADDVCGGVGDGENQLIPQLGYWYRSLRYTFLLVFAAAELIAATELTAAEPADVATGPAATELAAPHGQPWWQGQLS